MNRNEVFKLTKEKLGNSRSFKTDVIANSEAQNELIANSQDFPEMTEEFKTRKHEHVIHCAQGLKIFEDVKPPKGVNMLGNNEILQKNANEDKLLAIFDMDETLMHTVCYFENEDESNQKNDQPYDKKLAVNYPSGNTKYI
jgi:hypothetical protein